MVIENSFAVNAPPDRVYAYLLDVEKVVPCMPGAELVETVDSTTFKARIRIKVGPVVTSYNGTAQIKERNDQTRQATLYADGQEAVGSGSARASITMNVNAADDGALVLLTMDYSVAGRVAQFGRGIMEDVSRRMIDEMATCIRQRLETSDALPSNPVAPPTAKPVSGIRLIIGIITDRLRRLLGRAQ